MRYYKILGYQSNQPLVDCTPYNIENIPLGKRGKFLSVEEAEDAIKSATHFYYPKYPTGNRFSKFELLQLGVELVIIQCYLPDGGLKHED